jgi:hypothetical protein
MFAKVLSSIVIIGVFIALYICAMEIIPDKTDFNYSMIQLISMFYISIMAVVGTVTVMIFILYKIWELE